MAIFDQPHDYNRKTLKLKRHIVLDNKVSINSNRTTICITRHIAFLKFALLLKLWCHKHPYLQTFFSSVFIFCENSNCIHEITKKTMLSLIHLKKIGSMPPFLRDLGILKSDARFGTGTTIGRAMTSFSK